MKISNIIYFGTLLFLILTNSNYATNNDSLSYYLLREKIVSRDTTNEVLFTADELAKSGLYKEALELLVEFFEKPQPQEMQRLNLPPKKVSSKKKTKLRIATGIDHYHLEDIDTFAMTPEELKDYKRLTETPLSIWQRTTFDILFDSNFINILSPEVYNSQRKSIIAFTSEFSLPYHIIMRPELKVQKWHLEEGSFKPIKPLPSDMISGNFQISKEGFYCENTRYSLPFTVNIENYRYDSPGYESYIEYRIFPFFDLNIKYLDLQIKFAADFQYENYFRLQSDTLDVIRTLVGLESINNKKKYKSNITLRVSRDYYTKASNLTTIDRVESSIKVENVSLGKNKYGIKLKSLYEKEKYGKRETITSIRGLEVTTKPFIEYYLFNKKIIVGSDVYLEKRFSDKTISYFIWEARNSIEPALLFGWDSNYGNILIRFAYRYEDIDNFFETFTKDNRSFKGSIELSMSPFSFVSINFLTDYQYRLYANFTSSARVSENLTISFNTSLRF